MSTRNSFLLFVISFLLFSCNTRQEPKEEKIVGEKLPAPKDTFHRLCQYWQVTDAENPTYRDIADHQEEGVFNLPGIIFMTDSTFLENPMSVMRYGTFILTGKVIHAQFDDGKKAVYTIRDWEGNMMQLQRVEKDHTTHLHLNGAQTFWPDAALNPFNKMNSNWRIKPAKPESPEQLKARLKDCVRFYEYFFRGSALSESNSINFSGLPTCFKWYQGAILVKGPNNLDKKWYQCFYSDQQALEARQMMEDAVTSKKYDWDTTQTNWLKQTADVLKQIHDKM